MPTTTHYATSTHWQSSKRDNVIKELALYIHVHMNIGTNLRA